jgi:hypothetical protein
LGTDTFENDETHIRTSAYSCDAENRHETVLNCACHHRNYCLNGCIDYTTHATHVDSGSSSTCEHSQVAEDILAVTSADGTTPTPDNNAVGGLLGSGGSTCV